MARPPTNNGLTRSSVNHDADLVVIDTPTVEAMAAYDRLPPRIREVLRSSHCEMPPTAIEEELDLLRRKWDRFPGHAERVMLDRIRDVERSWLAGQPAWWRTEMAMLAAGFRRLAQRRGRAAA